MEAENILLQPQVAWDSIGKKMTMKIQKLLSKTKQKKDLRIRCKTLTVLLQKS